MHLNIGNSLKTTKMYIQKGTKTHTDLGQDRGQFRERVEGAVLGKERKVPVLGKHRTYICNYSFISIDLIHFLLVICTRWMS